MRHRYGVEVADVEALTDAQGNACAICGNSPADGTCRRLVVDHDHVTGVVRGLLCHPCNVGVGSMRDSIENLKRAVGYLTDPPASRIKMARSA